MEAQRSWILTIAENATGAGKTNLPVRLNAGKASVSHLPFPGMMLDSIFTLEVNLHASTNQIKKSPS